MDQSSDWRAGDSSTSANTRKLAVFADAGDDGFRFIFRGDPEVYEPTGEPRNDSRLGGLLRMEDRGHFVSIVGRGGTGKSILALQVITKLLDNAGKCAGWGERWSPQQKPAAFYFTLEASPRELSAQVESFKWGTAYKRNVDAFDDSLAETVFDNGLRMVPLPSPMEDLPALILQVRQTIARALPKIGELVAIVIDPLGGVMLGDDLRSDLSQLKQLSDSHRTFLFLLVEDHIFNQHPSIEHFSQSVMHMEHDPLLQPSRRLYVQKARNQSFRSGFHQYELQPKVGLRVYPSVQAQSANAHEEYERVRKEKAPFEKGPLLKSEGGFYPDQPVEPGSVVFLMGPPGTFKQFIVTRFCSAMEDSSAIYISFKADQSDVSRHWSKVPKSSLIELHERRPSDSKHIIRFLDARNPLSTPEEILSKVGQALDGKDSRAVVWGLRRLADMPNFEGSKAVQFLEALVTLLKTRHITSLLVDWPDIGSANTLPIVDLSQYILLTRPCKARKDLGELGDRFTRFWRDDRRNVSFLRVQRNAGGFHRDQGAEFFADKAGQVAFQKLQEDEFEDIWLSAGVRWETDPGLSIETAVRSGAK